MTKPRLQTVPHAGGVFGAGVEGVGGVGGSPIGPLNIVHVFWIAGMSCDGCSIAATGATNPSVEDLLLGRIPNLPKVVLHHPVLSPGAGTEFIAPFRRAAEGTLGAPYVVVLEGSVPDDQAFPSDVGYFSGMGVNHETGQPIRVTEWLWRLAPGAAAYVAMGTCASWGGIPAAAGNITGSMSLTDFLGKDYRSALGVPVVNIPGCSPVGDNFTETVAAVLLFLANLAPVPKFDELGRPAWLFEETVHRHCPKAGYYEEGVFAEEPGDNQCLVEIGCWGPVVQCNIVERGAINHMGGCMVAGGACIGCTMPGFPDKFSPFYKSAPGSALSGGVSKVTGGAIRRLRRVSMQSGNTNPMWDHAGAVPSGWADDQSGPGAVKRANAFFYKKLQYRGSVDYAKRNKKQPLPQSRNILQQGVHPQSSFGAVGDTVEHRETI
jgi:hydrogenase small subunit